MSDGLQTRFLPEQVRALAAFDGPFDAFRLPAENCEVLFATYPAGTVIEPHTHETDNVGVITEGRLFVTIDDVEASYGPGDWYHVAPGVEHAARFEVDTVEIEFWFGAE